MPIETTGKYVRIRIRNPRLFIKDSFRTVDIGKPGRHKLIRGRLKSSRNWATQSVLTEKDLYYKHPELTATIVKNARRT